MLTRTPFSMRKATVLSVVVLAILFSTIAAAQTPCVNCLNLNLQTSYVSIIANGNPNTAEPASTGDGYFQVPITGSTSASLPNGTYQGWCVTSESDAVIASPFNYTPASTYSPAVNTTVWNEVNWILNNKQFAGPATVDDVQHAIWIVINGSTPSPSTTAAALAVAAQLPAGQSFVPAPGQVMGVLLTSSVFGLQNILFQVQNPCGAIGDFVWNDQNGNGLQDSGEPGINGVTVTLTDTAGDKLSTVTSPAPAGFSALPAGSQGYYQFAGLCAGSYTISIDNTQSGLTGYIPTTTLAGSGQNPTIDSNPNPAIVTLPTTAGSMADETIGFGYWAPSPPTAPCPAINNAVQNVAIAPVQMSASGGAGGPYTFTAANLPAGLSMSSNGTISGTPTLTGTSTYTVTIKDAAGITGTSTCSITVNPPPSTNCVSITAVQGAAIAPVTLTGSGGAGGPYSFAAIGLPGGLSIAQNGTISGTPTVSGTFPYTVTITDVDGNTGTTNCSVTVSPAPSANCAVINAVYNVAITPVTMIASGGAGGPYTFTATGLPAGLSISTSGTISGTPTVSGTFPYTVTIADSAGNKGTTNCSVTVALPPITASCASITATSGTPITPVTMIASGGMGGPYTFTATGLPAGLSISTSGTISGTPTVSGTFPYTVTIADVDGNTGTVNCSVVVGSPQTTPPLALTCPSNLGQLGVAYSSAAVASGGVAPYTYSMASGTLPAGLTLNTSTGVITGTPTAAGSFNFSIMVTDSLGSKAVSSCSCTPSSTTWSFASPTGNQGYSQPYTVNGVTITAYGYNNWGWPTALYGNNSGSDQYGLGLDATWSNEIDTSNFVQLDLTSVIASGAQNAMMTITSVGSGSYNVYGSNWLGSIGTALFSTNQTIGGTPFAIPNFGKYKYISVRASSGSVLLGAVSFTLGNCNITVTTPVDIQCGTCGAGGKATVGTPYTATLTASGGSGKYTFAILPGTGYNSLPPGLTLAPLTGVISGTPTAAGTYTFTSRVTDSAGNTHTVVCTIVVIAVPLDLECGTCGQGKATVGTPYSVKLSATGGTGPYTYTMTGGTLPPGLTFSNGAITGTPTAAGTYTISTKVVDANGNSDTSTCTIVVVGSPINLDCGPCSAGKAYLGQVYSATMAVSGGKAPYTFSITSGSLPPGLKLAASTGVISGTPTTAGTYTFTAKVVDAGGNSASDDCTIVVVGAPPVNLDCGACGSGSTNGKVGTAYSATLSVSGGKSPFKFSISSGSLPPGLTLSASGGAITGTPTSAGTYTFTAMVTDANGSKDTATCTITITGSSINLGCGACGSGKATVGVSYSSTLTVTGGTPGYTFSISSGSLPPGLKLTASSGLISGKPTTAGTYTFTSKVVDSRGNTDTQSCTIVVTGTSINLNCATSCGTSSYTSVGASYSAALTVTGGSAPFTYSIVSGSLPAGLKLAASTGVISGTPTTAGTYTFTSKVVDSKGNTDTQSCTIVVAPSALNLVCGTCGNGKATVGTFYSATMSVTGGSAPFAYSIVSNSLPQGLTLDSSKGVISGTPTTAGTYVFTTKVVDSKGKTDTATCTIVVAGSPINLDCGPCSAGKATVGTGYSATMAVTGGKAPYTFSLISGSLPAGLTLNTTSGVISGTPTTAGTYTFTTKVVDSNGNADTDTCSIVVISPINLDCGPCSAGKTSVGASYSATMTVTGGKGPYTFSIVAGSLPQGVTLNTSTGQLSGKPTTAGSFTFTTKVVDGNGNSDTDTCTIVVEPSGWCGGH